MAPLFLFLLIGIGLGIGTGLIRHEDWIGTIADLEMATLGAIAGGMTFVLTGNRIDDWLGAFVVSLLTALVFLGLLKRIIYREPAHRHS